MHHPLSIENVAIVGATGTIGQTFLELYLNTTGKIPTLYGSQRSAGRKIFIRGHEMEILPFDENMARNHHYLLLFTGANFSSVWAQKLAKNNGYVIDCSGFFRNARNVPMVIPKINGAAALESGKNLICSPNCCTVLLLHSLWPLHGTLCLKKLFVSTYQSVSGSGKMGVAALQEELAQPSYPLLVPSMNSPYSYPIAHNVIGAIGAVNAGGHSEEETNIRTESRRIMGLACLPMDVCCVRVPIAHGHSMAVGAFFKKNFSLEEIRELFTQSSLLKFCEETIPTPIQSLQSPLCSVGRLRRSFLHKRAINFWITADQRLFGTALNAFGIMELFAGEKIGGT
ncbi:MAG: aspartate-semialdehyde dehydrogenase [Puniceicoccales bacterium]|jgi:aspartate-semialdehyde dehydrogenase|nr:aspartate-semialdehyde dehydrogenase [Puniceicoccales bacterium]